MTEKTPTESKSLTVSPPSKVPTEKAEAKKEESLKATKDQISEAIKPQKLHKSFLDEVSGNADNKLPLGVALCAGTIATIKYLQVILESQEKWFHFAIIAMIAFGSIQIYQFYLNQKQIDAKIESLRNKKSRSDNLSNSSRESSTISVEDIDKTNGDPTRKNSSPTEILSPASPGRKDSKTEAPLKTDAEDAEEVANSVSKHSQEMSEHLKTLASALKETNQESIEALSIEQRSSCIEEEFIGKASKARQELPITRICLTGGPCAGKTTALAELSLVLNQMGFRVLQVPEAAMILKKGGVPIDARSMTFTQAVKHQKNLMKLQMDLEQIFIDIAQMQQQHTIILIDRGVMDGQAYSHEDVWQAILDETGWSTIQLRDKRYEAVVHMMTAAEGAEEFYMTLSSSSTQTPIEQAREIDRRLIEAWVGHPQFNIVKNTKKGFKTKIDYCLKRVLSFIGMPQPTNLTRKYLLATDKPIPEINVPEGVKKEMFQLEETFITTNVGTANILRKVGKNDAFTYSHEMRYEVNNEKIQKKRQITAREYIELSENPDLSKRKIMKNRQCFIYQRQYFMVETFLNLPHYPSILRVEATNEGQKTKLPPFLKIVREVSNDNAYETWFMAKQDYEMPEDDIEAIHESLFEERAEELTKLNEAKHLRPGSARPGSALRRKHSNEADGETNKTTMKSEESKI